MPKRVLRGKVISTKGAKTAVVRVINSFSHPLYKKTVRVSKNYAAHDEENLCIEGQDVHIMESRPISKTKKWTIYKILGEKKQ